MGRKIFIFCEECGTRLEVDENDPKVFCEECGAEIDNVRYRPEEDEETNVFAANSVVGESEAPHEDVFDTYEDNYTVEEYTDELDEEVADLVEEAISAVPEAHHVLQSMVNNSFARNTVVNNYVTTKTATKVVTSTNSNIYRNDDEDEVKEIFVDHEYIEDVVEGTPVTYYAVVERRGRFFTGECPEVPFTTVDKADSFEECIEEIKDEL